MVLMGIQEGARDWAVLDLSPGVMEGPAIHESRSSAGSGYPTVLLPESGDLSLAGPRGSKRWLEEPAETGPASRIRVTRSAEKRAWTGANGTSASATSPTLW